MGYTENKERPIIFSAHMCQAIALGLKTQTRRVIKPQPTEGGLEPRVFSSDCPDLVSWQDPLLLLDEHSDDGGSCQRVCPFGSVGDHLWVKEGFFGDNKGQVIVDSEDIRTSGFYKWKSPIFMPRWASRLTLEITEIRVEPLLDITSEDVVKEGISSGIVADFVTLWDSLHKKEYQWQDKPWVWVISFRKLGE